MIKNYAIIDHIGSIDSGTMKRLYPATYNKAKEDGFVTGKYDPAKNVYTMKQVALKMTNAQNPDNELINKLKNLARNQKNPVKVYIICDSINDNVEWNESKWSDRMREVENEDGTKSYVFIQTEIIAAMNELYYFGQELSEARRCALHWGNALGWTFSAPLVRDQQLSAPDLYIRNHNMDKFFPMIEDYVLKSVEHDGKETRIPTESFFHNPYEYTTEFIVKKEILVEYLNKKTIIKNLGGKIINEKPVTYNVETSSRRDYSQASKISTKAYTYRKNNIIIAPESECIEFYRHFMYLKGYDPVTWPNGKLKLTYFDEKGKQRYSTTEGTPMFVRNEDREDILEYMLEPKYKICPNCGMPYRDQPSNTDVLETYEERLTHADMAQCQFCDSWYELEEPESETFYEDTYQGEDFDIDNLDLEFADREPEEYEEEE